jgi:glycerol-3-phosphate cytidylyltransferase
MTERVVLTYGTFDLFHVGHLRLLMRARELGDRLLVGVSSDEFNAGKGKKTIIDFDDRIEIVRSIRCVDGAFAETCWEQKRTDIEKYGASALVMGNDWMGKFDDLKDMCEVLYLPRTVGISSTHLKKVLGNPFGPQLQEIRAELAVISEAIQSFRK